MHAHSTPLWVHHHHHARDVDHVLTTKELAVMLTAAHIDLASLPPGEYDTPFGITSGGGLLFGSSGGVMEAALRVVYRLCTGERMPPDALVWEDVPGLQGVCRAQVDVCITQPGVLQEVGRSLQLHVAVVHGLHAASQLLDAMHAGILQFHAVEVMACPGGCIGGGGQPPARYGGNGICTPIRCVCQYVHTHNRRPEVLTARRDALRMLDATSQYHDSSENPDVQALYTRSLHAPGSTLAKELLHTQYAEAFHCSILYGPLFITIHPHRHLPGGAAAVQDEGVGVQAAACGQQVRAASALAPPPPPAWCTHGVFASERSTCVDEARRECAACAVLAHTCEDEQDECCYCG